MNEQLIKFIELCLMDGVVTDKEREVIFRKSKELGVPEDECEIILEGMIQQKGGEVQSKEVSLQTSEPVSNSFEEKKPELIKRKTLHKQPELESSISKIDSKYSEIEKQNIGLKEQLNQCLSYDVVTERKMLKETISSYKSLDELQKTLEIVKKNIITVFSNHPLIMWEKSNKDIPKNKSRTPLYSENLGFKKIDEDNKKYIDRINFFLKENPDFKTSWGEKKKFSDFILPIEDLYIEYLFSVKKIKSKEIDGIRLYPNIMIVFKWSFFVLRNGIYNPDTEKFFHFNCFENYTISKDGFLTKPKYKTKENEVIGGPFGMRDDDGHNLDIFLKYLYGDKDERMKNEVDRINKNINDQEVERKKIETQNKKELEELDTIISIINKLFELSEEQTKLKSKNELKYRIILNEKLLNNFPNQTYGSVIFYNELNKNSTLFDNSHLNKITRFLNFIETHEDKYLRLYDRCVGLYIDDPNNKCFNELIIKLETINHYYEIMKSLINNVNKDKVLYNKLYNLIEDEGIFMTKTEKESLNYMKKVSSGVIELNKNIVDGFNILESQLSDVSSGLSDLDSGLLMISSSMDDINMNLSDTRRR